MRNRDYWILLHTEQVQSTGAAMETRVTLRPGEKGTKTLAAQYGPRLVCVRYRYDAAARVRYKTVELIVEQVPWDPAQHALDPAGRPGRPPSLVGVQVGYDDRGLQRKVRQAGGRWVREQRVWVLPLAVAKRLGLEHRLVPMPDSVAPHHQVYHEKSTDKPPGEAGEIPTDIN